MKNQKIKLSLQVVSYALKNDVEYRQTWIDNISICFQDQYRLSKRLNRFATLKSISDKAANRFIDILLNE